MATTTVMIDLAPKPPETAAEIFEGVTLPEATLDNLIAELKALKQIESEKGRNVYREGEVPVTLAFLRQYMIEFPDLYIYNEQLAQFIIGQTALPPEWRGELDTAVYLAQGAQGALINKLRTKRFLADGYVWEKDFPAKEGQKVIAQIRNYHISGYSYSEIKGTLKEIPGHGWWLLPPRSRNRGYELAKKEMLLKPIAKFS